MLFMIPTLPGSSTERLSTGVVAYEIPTHSFGRTECLSSNSLISEADLDMDYEVITAGRFDQTQLAVFYACTYCGQTFITRITDPSQAILEFKLPAKVVFH